MLQGRGNPSLCEANTIFPFIPVGCLPPGAPHVQPALSTLCRDAGEGSDVQEHLSAEFPCIGGLSGNLGPLQGTGMAGEMVALQPTGVCERR